ncbi:DNA polymerase epsilon subunit 3-like [Coffea eugenioides]|uniref:DNA polymerase epsilon subunit 3-like n=1 Tax=Coffea eugenioides TaxID=49369 RepID=UPI000F612C33|nr:DNA polymerase epsilon subunit 3-like [Coffea eugenioides]
MAQLFIKTTRKQFRVKLMIPIIKGIISDTSPEVSDRMVEKEKEKEKAKENGEVTTVTESTARELEELPKTIVLRLVKDKLSQLSAESEISVFREALQAFSESGRIFIHYLTAAANDICKESNRQIINAEDVFKALEEIDFPEFVQSLRAFLEEFRQRNASQTFFFGLVLVFLKSFIGPIALSFY